MTAVDVNLYGTVHGGVIMKFIDDVAGAAAARHSGGTAGTASIDEPAVVPDSPENLGRGREAEIRREHRLARREAIQRHRASR